MTFTESGAFWARCAFGVGFWVLGAGSPLQDQDDLLCPLLAWHFSVGAVFHHGTALDTVTLSSPGRTSRTGCQSWTLGAPMKRTWTQRHQLAPRACWKSGLGGGPRKVSIKVASAFFLPMSTPSRPPGEGPSAGPEAAVTLPSVSQKGPSRLLSPAPAHPPRAPSPRRPPLLDEGRRPS